MALERLGHSQFSTTMNIYSHDAEEIQSNAADRAASSLWGSPGAGLPSYLLSNGLRSHGAGQTNRITPL